MSTSPLRNRHGLAVSTEHYLRAILELREERGYARVVDIATRLGITKGSVSIALGHLEERGLVRFDAARFPKLTPPGRRVAMDVRGRFKIVLTFLTDVLGLPPDRASAEACRWEHVISHDAADRMLDLLRFASEDEEQRRLLDRFQGFHRQCGTELPCSTCRAHGPVEIFCLEPKGEPNEKDA
ncbi:MAG: metal-dependent transcriptional regulator [Candidatus Eisenbacteria bacterium]|nr:metal-dependent transcriptional regulator [Candidatus Eisenbacteria bacterium]